MEKEIKEKASTNNSSVDVRICRNQHSLLVRKFVGVMEDHNSSQSEYRDKCKEQVMRQLAISGKDVSDSTEIDDMVEQGTTIFTQDHIIATEHARQQCAEIEDRHEEILSLEASIKELHDMFVEMATMVELHGEVMDSIEQHCIAALEYVEGSNEEIHQYIKLTKEKRALRLKIIGIGSVVSIILILVLICGIKYALH